MTFDDWMRSVNPRHQPTDDGMETRILRRCWEAATTAEREGVAAMCVERSVLSWAAADETPFDKDRAKHEVIAEALANLASELRAQRSR